MLVFGPKPTRYQPTDDDVLWLLRAVEAEGPVRRDVARALVNLFSMLRAHGGSRSLTEVVRAYAQPVNPRWFPDGDLFLKQASPNPTLLKRAVARESIHSSRTAFSPETSEAVNEALTTPFQSDITDYAVPTIDASKKGYVARSAPTPGINRLWTRRSGWPGYGVENG